MWNWSFGDGFWQNGTEQNATHIYLTSGIYTVTEYATNPGDFHNYTLFDYITVYNTTISGFTANVTSGVEPLAVGFNVTTGVDNATQWNWSFGDGTWQNGTDQNATHVYSNGGIYTVIEIASNAAFSNMTTLIDYVTVYNKTISGFTATFLTSNIEPSLVGFNVTNADDNATQWNWSFGDGTWQNGTDQNVTHIYSNGGIYTVSEIASNDGDSNTTTLIDYITIYNRTISGFESNVTVGTEPLAVGFNVTTVTDNATRWNWSFGDGTLYNGTDQTLYQNVSHVYSNGGIYTVTETAQDGPSYNITQLVDYITVYNQTHNTFTSNETSGFIPLSITFLLTNDTNVTFWNWSFGDGTWSNYTNGSATVIHTYTTVNNFTVNLTTS
jgi:PKD repeat protein